LVDHRPAEPAINRQRIRVPQQNKSALHLPPLSQAIGRLETNRQRIQSQASQLLAISFLPDSPPLGELQHQAKHELVDLALSYSNQYLPSSESVQLTDQPIVMSGHQPSLYHAGVWYKNFVLSELANRTNAIAINLVVDSDLSTNQAIRCPDLNATPIRTQTIAIDTPAVRTQTVAIDTPAAVVPFEQRLVQDSSFFFELPDRIAKVHTFADDPCIAERLWPEVIQSYHELAKSNRPPALGATIAAGRHRFEQAIGLKTIEVPASALSQTTAFATFAAAIFDRASKFRDTYNHALVEYRNVNRIRSNSHPVPALEQTDDWTEVPFWVSSKHTPDRQRLFIRTGVDAFELSDRKQFHQVLPKAGFIPAFKQLNILGVAIRPRAISTTMFCRLLISDIFIHGVGGSKYDQLTDAISQRFFGYGLPEFLTVSATFRLPTQIPKIAKSDITKLKTRRREYNFHPERFLAKELKPPKAATLIKQKRQWIDSSIRSREKHLAITQTNQALRALLTPSDEHLNEEIDSLTAQLKSSEIANSREYSFCLFGESLIDDLKQLVQANFA